jgi:hypothetical protein
LRITLEERKFETDDLILLHATVNEGLHKKQFGGPSFNDQPKKDTVTYVFSAAHCTSTLCREFKTVAAVSL